MFPLTKGKYFLPFMYYTIKLVYVVVPSIVFENISSRYFENDFLHLLQMWQHRFSQELEAKSNVTALGHSPFKKFYNT